MITPYLEELIHGGRAEYRRMALGGSGVGTIPIQPNERLVITDFIWNAFSDQRPVAEDYAAVYRPIVGLNYNADFPGNIGDDIQALDLLNVQIGLGRIVDIDFLLMIAYVSVSSGDFSTIVSYHDVTFGSDVPVDSITITPFAPIEMLVDIDSLAVAIINNDSPNATPGASPGILTISNVVGNFNPGDVITGDTSGANAILVGELIPDPGSISISATVTEAVRNCIHTLRFRSKNKQAHFNLKDMPAIEFLISGEEQVSDVNWFFFAPIIQLDTYLFFAETVQVDIFKFSPTGNVFTTGNPTPYSQEPTVPNGYRDAVAHPPVLQITTGQGAVISALGKSREQVPSVARSKDQFVDDVGDLTELRPPFNNNSFPLVNVGYVVLFQPEKPIV